MIKQTVIQGDQLIVYGTTGDDQIHVEFSDPSGVPTVKLGTTVLGTFPGVAGR